MCNTYEPAFGIVVGLVVGRGAGVAFAALLLYFLANVLQADCFSFTSCAIKIKVFENMNK